MEATSISGSPHPSMHEELVFSMKSIGIKEMESKNSET
jgi:hypothetical protein